MVGVDVFSVANQLKRDRGGREGGRGERLRSE